MTVVADNLRRLMDARQVRLSRLSKDADIPERTIRRILTGETQAPLDATLCALAIALDAEVSDLTGIVTASALTIEARLDDHEDRLSQLEREIETQERDQGLPLRGREDAEMFRSALEQIAVAAGMSPADLRVRLAQNIRAATDEPVREAPAPDARPGRSSQSGQ